jgi:hypothetical protein
MPNSAFLYRIKTMYMRSKILVSEAKDRGLDSCRYDFYLKINRLRSFKSRSRYEIDSRLLSRSFVRTLPARE